MGKIKNGEMEIESRGDLNEASKRFDHISNVILISKWDASQVK